MIKNRYIDLIDQTFYFPQESFRIDGDYLLFNDVPIKELIDNYGTPLKISYLPKIGSQIQKAKHLFNEAITRLQYPGKYYYCYCTKSSHFRYVLDEVLKNEVQLETSSSFDIDLIWRLYLMGKISRDTILVHNGFKTTDYKRKICQIINDGFHSIPICDNIDELAFYEQGVQRDTCNIGVRVATEEEPQFDYYTSRMGIRYSAVLPFLRERIANNPKFNLKMLHFFVDTGIKDTIYYWNELQKGIKLYCQIKQICPEISALNIGGGLPIQNSLAFNYDYDYMLSEIVNTIFQICKDYNVPPPDIFTEFGKYTVGESGATIFSVIGQKLQNDSELWYMVDNSLITTLPDSWGITERFVLLPINKWHNEYSRVNIGGISCDNSDYYVSEAHFNQVILPKFDASQAEPLYLGFFHTGAYQDALSGYGGIKHCLIPSPKHIIIDRDAYGNIRHWQNFREQTAEQMLQTLGY